MSDLSTVRYLNMILPGRHSGAIDPINLRPPIVYRGGHVHPVFLGPFDTAYGLFFLLSLGADTDDVVQTYAPGCRVSFSTGNGLLF